MPLNEHIASPQGTGIDIQAWDNTSHFTYAGAIYSKNAVIVNLKSWNRLDADARQEQLDEISRQAAGGGHQAPDRDADGDDAASAEAVRQPADRDSEDGIEKGEGRPHDEPHLCVAEIEILANRLDE